MTLAVFACDGCDYSRDGPLQQPCVLMLETVGVTPSFCPFGADDSAHWHQIVHPWVGKRAEEILESAAEQGGGR